MIIGIDKGTAYTKTDQGLSFRSTLRTYSANDIVLNDDKTVIEVDGEKYVVGDKGNYSTDLMKSKHKNTRLFVLTAIAMSTKESYTDLDLVTGLPIGLFSQQKEQMKKIFENTSNQIHVNGNRKVIKIRKTEVFPEAAGVYYSQKDYLDALVIDIGGLSIDTALFRNKKLIKYSTYSMGIMKLYSKIANRLNSEYDLSLTEWDIETVLNDGLYIYGEQVKLNVHDLILEHTREILERLELEYDIKTLPNVIVAGGGSSLLSNYFAQDIPQIRSIQNAQFANAIGYGKIGKVIFT